mgnify:CR=1 FL=1
MSVEEVCKYTGWGMTKTREILKRSDSDFTIRVGNRLYSTTLFDLDGTLTDSSQVQIIRSVLPIFQRQPLPLITSARQM